MNGTDINDTSLKTRYPKLSSDTDSTFLGGLVLEKSIVDPTYGFENCRNLSTFKMFLTKLIEIHQKLNNILEKLKELEGQNSRNLSKLHF